MVPAKSTAQGRATPGGYAVPACRLLVYALPPPESPGGQEEERMNDFESLAHVRWECKHPILFIPKYRRRAIFGKGRTSVGQLLRDLCQQKGLFRVLSGRPLHVVVGPDALRTHKHGRQTRCGAESGAVRLQFRYNVPEACSEVVN